MGFRINTNIGAMNAHSAATLNNRNLDDSLSKLSSGLRINKAADDASGMAIADSLRSQASGLGQAISNANDAIGLIQTADKAMDEQIKILDTIKTKAIQASSDTQNGTSREAIQKDVNRLLEQLDNIANTTSFNGQTLLNGAYTNKSFQVGAYSNQAITTSISDTRSNTTGSLSDRVDTVLLGGYMTASVAAAAGSTSLNTTAGIKGIALGDVIKIEGVTGTYTVTAHNSITGAITLGTSLASTVATTAQISIATAAKEATPVTLASGGSATSVTLSGAGMQQGLAVGDILTFTSSSGTQTATIASINGTAVVLGTAMTGSLTAATSVSMADRAGVGTVFGANQDWVRYTVEGVDLAAVQLTDGNGYGVAGSGLGAVAKLINASTDETGIKAVAMTDINSDIVVNQMTLTSDMKINGEVVLQSGSLVQMGDSNAAVVNAINAKTTQTGVTASISTQGKLQLQSTDGRTVRLEGFGGATGITDGTYAGELKLMKTEAGNITVTSTHYGSGALAAANANAQTSQAVVTNWRLDDIVGGTNGEDATVGLMRTQKGAMIAIDIAETAIKELDSVRANLGSVQNQLTVTVNNISVTQVNVKAAESQIRDVDFAAESANFSKFNILAQSGSYAMSQANAMQQNVLRLLQ